MQTSPIDEEIDEEDVERYRGEVSRLQRLKKGSDEMAEYEYKKVLTIRAEVPTDKEEYEMLNEATQEEIDAFLEEGKEEIAQEIGCVPEEITEFKFAIEEVI